MAHQPTSLQRIAGGIVAGLTGALLARNVFRSENPSPALVGMNP